MKFMPILLKGEKLAEQAKKANSGSPKSYPYTYEEARDRTINDINSIGSELKQNRDYFLENEIILSVRMNEKFLAKSYAPSFFHKKESMEIVGARIYDRKTVNSKEEKSKLYFLKCSKDNLEWFMKDLQEDNFNKTEQNQLRSIDKLDVLKPEEKTLGFNENDKILDVEIVLHPIHEQIKTALDKVTTYLSNDYEIRKYENGPIFILGKIDRKNLINLANYNFLRTIHPIREINLPTINRGTEMQFDLPKVPISTKSNKSVKIGVFDGGINIDNPYLKHYVINNEIASLGAKQDYLEHGTAVCGTILYGEMNKYKSNEFLEEPPFIVENFRVLPEVNWYKIIDNIEKVVMEREDIDIYNISFGPRGPILDDQIDRFTYALDKLALNNKLFTIAVGNDGEVTKPFNRIQVPSDSVNNIGVGAYSIYANKYYRASYSCIGIGREGGKVKPDILAFGGDERTLFQAINLAGNARAYTAGTSFASPLVARKLGELICQSTQLNLIHSRSLLIHTAKTVINKGEEEGFGIVADNIKEVLNCSETKVTILYEGYIYPSRFMKLPIPVPNSDKLDGNMTFTWTICTLSDIDTKDSDLYTNSCIEESFYPNSDIYKFTNKEEKESIKVNIKLNPELADELKTLGYTQSLNPVCETGNRKSEIDRRLEYKWDTISTKSKGKNSSGISNPFLIISALSRDDDDMQKIKFCVAVTVENKKYRGNMYEDILNKYKVLLPLELVNEAEDEIEQNT